VKRMNINGTSGTLWLRHRRVHYGKDGAAYLLLPLRLASGGLLIALAWLHFHLWEVGYRHISTIGPLFLITAISGLTLALYLLLRPSRFIAVVGLGLALGLLAGLIVSVNVGLFGFSESLSAPYVIESLMFELAAALTLASWVLVDLIEDMRQRARVESATWKATRELDSPADRTATSS
jgi:hypothetical protein